MKHSIAYLAALFLLTAVACQDANDVGSERKSKASSSDVFIFGSFYGMCFGEDCVEFYAIENEKLYEDTKIQYPLPMPYEGEYELQSDERYQLVKELVNEVPDELFSVTDKFIGCPDCADGGGIYIGIKSSEGDRFWLIDNDKSQVPEYLHDFIDEVNAKINLLR